MFHITATSITLILFSSICLCKIMISMMVNITGPECLLIALRFMQPVNNLIGRLIWKRAVFLTSQLSFLNN